MNKIITLSAVAFLSTALYANSDLDAMKVQMDELNAKIEKMEKTQKKQTKKISEVNKKANNDNIKWDVDFRTAYDNLSYKTAGGVNPMTGMLQKDEYQNDNLYSMRLWLGMGYAPTDDMVFKGQLAMHKAFGASYGQRGTGMGFDTFDWVVNENLTDGTVRVREAYWLWTPTTGDIGWTVSLGRRPATNGYLINLRDDDKAKSPLGHVINMEFDGASVGIKLDKFSPGLGFKLCAGRGLTNASSWSSKATYFSGSPMGGANIPSYTVDDNNIDNTDLIGFILSAYDDGQYAVKGTYFRGFNVPGNVSTPGFNPFAPITPANMMYMQSLGEMDGAAISFKVEGIGDEWSDFLDDTIFFASMAWSKSNPNGSDRFGNQYQMLGSTYGESKSGDSYWIGTQMPNLTGGRFGMEFNHGSANWKPFTFGEDTFAGSKMATRGDAYDVYWTQPIVKALSLQFRYTLMKYDYMGSDGFFGEGAAAAPIGSMMANAMNAVESAQDIRVYLRYRY